MIKELNISSDKTENIISLLGKAGKLGISIFLKEDKLMISTAKDTIIDQAFLGLIRSHKEEIKAFLSAESNSFQNDTSAEKIELINRAEGYQFPLSFAQEDLWFIDHFESSSHYHIPLVFRLSGEPVIETIAYALNLIVNRHESLRTIFIEKDGIPHQELLPEDCWKLYLDHDQTANLPKDYLETFIQAPFDLSSEHMLRAALCQVKPEEYFLTIVIHHIACDGWSIPLLIQELTEIYTAKTGGRLPLLPELKVQYADYAAWQRQTLTTEKIGAKLTYWETQLKSLSTLKLPEDFPRPAEQSTKGAKLFLKTDKVLTDKLRVLAKEQGVTMNMLLLSVFNVLLYRHTHQTDIAVGTPVANREQRELNTLIGFFVNTIVLRTRLNGEMVFEELLNEVKSLTLQAYRNQDVPFAKVVRKIQKQRDKSRSPLFQVMFVFQQQEDMKDLQMGDLNCSMVPYAYPVSRFDLTLSVNELPNNLEVVLEYCTDLFLPSTIAGMGAHYLRLLSAVSERTDIPIGQLEMLSVSEKVQLLTEFNDTAVNYSSTETVVDLFQQQVNANPQAIALVYEQTILSYIDLDVLSSQFAHYLLADNRFKKEGLIAVKLPRSEWLITVIMAILKGGAAYVPIDPDFPEERVDYILSDSKCDIIIDESVIKDFIIRKNDYSDKRPGAGVSQSDLAYIIYTSGTTGKPKGVMIEHGGIYNLAVGQISFLKLTDDDHVLQFAAATFDIFCAELFSTLAAGAKLCIPTRSMQLSMDDMKDFIRSHEITVATIPPSYQVLLVDHLSSLKTVISAGEIINIKLTELLQQRGVNVINGYGPTESSVYVTMSSDPIIEGYKSTIGKPLENVKIYILDENNQLAPVGVIGELCAGGIQVARGYLNRPDLTAEKFIPNPFDNEGGNCPVLYRTGDLARWLPDGNIEYAGRIDHQVKIRGYRIELGEIEAALERYEPIKQAVVKIYADEQENKKIVAYVIAENELNESALYSHLKSILPQYMLPSLYVRLEEFPLTSSNKVDRLALPDPDMSSFSTKGYAAPTNPTEEKLAQLWSVLLNIKEVGIHTNFFEIGGDSIIAIQFVSRAKELGLTFRVKDVFDHQTISRLAEQLQQSNTTLNEQGVLEGHAFLLPVQKWFFEADFKCNDHFNQSILLNLNKNIDHSFLTECFDHLLNQHDALRFRYEDSEHSGTIQSYGNNRLVPDIRDLSGSNNFSDDVLSVCEFYQQKLSLEEGILIRMVFIKTPDQEEFNRLFLVTHHLVIDGVSWRILIDDLCTFLRDIVSGKRVDPGLKTTSYRQWGNLLHDYAKSAAIHTEFGYWKDALAGFVPLSTVQPDHNLNTHLRSDIRLQLSKSQTHRLLQKSNSAYHTEINDLLLCALTQVICDWAERKEFVLALEGHGRELLFEHADLSKTVGWFTTIFPVKLSMEDDESLSGLIIRLKEQMRSVPNKGIGYGVLRYLSEDAEKRKCLEVDFGQIIFNYLGNFDAAMNGNEFVNLASEYAGSNNSPANHNVNAMEVSINIAEGHLNLVWTYDVAIYSQSTIEFLVNRYHEYLNEIIDHCCSLSLPIKTPSDYGLTGVANHSSLDVFMKDKLNLEDIYTLSPLQNGMLFHSLYQKDSGAYIVQFACDFINGLVIDDFRNAWKQLIATHSILRTGFFYEVFESPVQCVFGDVELPLTIVDYSGLKGGALELALTNFLKDDSQRVFDLEQPPLMRISLILLAEHRVKMVWTNHHIILDGWSMSVLIREFLVLYKRLRSGRSLSDVDKVDYFKDLIAYQRKVSKADSERHWSQYLAQLKSPTLLPFIHQRVPRNKQLGNQVTQFVAEEHLTRGLHDFAKQQHLTLNTIIQGAWAYLLSRYTGTTQVVFGTTVSGRMAAIHHVEDRVGLYINTIPVCIGVENDLNIISWLRKIQEDHAVSTEYSHTPLADIRVITGFDEDFFDSLVVFENYPVSSITEAETDLKIENVHSQEQTHYSLLLCVKTDENLTIDFSYHSELLALETVQLMITHLTVLLDAIVNPHHETIADLNYMTAVEEERLLFGLNHSLVSYPENRTVVSYFEEQVKLYPDRIALVDQDVSLSYQVLDGLSNRLARVLRNAGVGRNSIVGLLTGRTQETVIGMLGILKAGGAYLPMDLDYPQDRISYLLEDSQAVLLLVTATDYLVSYDITTMVVQQVLEQDEISLEALPSENLAEDLCYVIYTSGTTGYPKGVLVEHRNVVRLFFHSDPLFDFGAEDVWTMFHNPYFDFSVWEMYGALLYGGKLVMIPKMVARDPGSYLSLLVSHGVTVLNQTPSAFYNLIEAESYAGLSPDALKLRYVIFGGEALKPLKLSGWYARYPDIALINMFGITETTVHVTYKLITEQEIGGNVSNIGTPIPTLSAYIFDPYQRLVPQGVTGELYVGGAGVSRGYLNRPELNASRFVPNPYRAEERLYRTGDLCRQQANGELEYIGRIDHQVKIRGYRIELGEIESRLLEHDQISDVVVLVREDHENNSSLCAYLVSTEELELSVIRSYLSGVLPDYMVPSHFVQVPFLPQTGNGKVDRDALPAPVPQDGSAYVAAESDLDIALSKLWSSVLQVAEVGLTSNFFSLGGDSMLALKLVSRINRDLGLKMSIADLFTYQCIGELSPRLVAVSPLSDEKEVVAGLLASYDILRSSFLESHPSVNGDDVSAVYPASDIQKGMLYHSMKERGLYHDQMVHVVRYPDHYLSLLDQAMGLLIEKHSILRTGFYQGEEELLQVVFTEGVADIRYQDLSELSSSAQEAFIRESLEQDKDEPFGLGEPGLFRLLVFRLEEGRSCVCLVCHHAIIDGWSEASLNTELHNTLMSLSADPEFRPAGLRHSYLDFVIDQHLASMDGRLQTYWQEALKDYKRFVFSSVEEVSEYRTHQSSLDGALLSGLNSWNLSSEVSVRSLCFSAFVYALYMLSYENDLTVGLVTNNRPALEDGDQILGCFLNTVPFRTSVPEQGSWLSFVQGINTKLNGQKEYERLSFSKIVSGLHEASGDQNPITDVLFNYVDFHVYDALQGAELNEGGGAVLSDGPVADQGEGVSGETRNNSLFNLNVDRTGGELKLSLCYQSNFVSGSTVEQFMSYYHRVLELILSSPDSPIGMGSVLSVQEQEQLLYGFNATAAVYPADQTILDLFVEQVGRNPEAVALSDEQRSMTYEELDQHSSQLANYLRNHEVTSGNLVPVYMDRSAELIVVLLGVMKAGCAYIPIDPSHPKERIEYILEDISAPLVITANSTAAAFEDSTIRVINIDQIEDKIRKEAAFLACELPTSKALVYIMYTSGTTGKPKGVMIAHQALYNFILSMTSLLEASRNDLFLSLTTFSFDISCLEFYLPLCTGGQLVIASVQALSDPQILIADLEKLRPAYVQATPSRWQMLLDAGLKCTGNTKILSGGEALTDRLKDQLVLIAKQPIWNLYGPTETTIWSSSALLNLQDRVNIGKPIANTRLYILDKDMNLLPPGVNGDLYIGGDGLSQGYYGKPELTREKFINYQFSAEKEELIYKTGDIGKWLSSGNIQLSGRADNQIKIDGYRMEAAEIEYQLLALDQLKEAVVMAKEHNGNKLLVAYLVTSREIEDEEIRTQLLRSLPIYMVPSLFIRLEEMPQTANGKIDRKLLPEPVLMLSGSRAHISPIDQIEEKLLVIWGEILSIDLQLISTDRNFFEMGGNSVKAVHLMIRIQKEFSKKIELREIFTYSSISKLATLIRESLTIKDTGIPVLVKEGPFLASAAQERIFYKYISHKESLAYNISGAYYLEGQPDPAKIEQVLQLLTDRHEGLKTSFYMTVDGLMQRINKAVSVGLQFLNAANIHEGFAKFIKPFDLSEGPLVRFGLLNLKGSGQALLFDVHHIVADGISLNILMQDFKTIFQGNPLDKLKYSYVDYAAWQRSSTSTLSKQREFWRDMLSGDLPWVELAEHNHDVPDELTVARVQLLTVDNELYTAIKNFTVSAKVSDFMFLLSVYYILIYKMSDQTDLIIGSDSIGRTDSDLRNVVGTFVNILPLRINLDDEEQYREFLNRLREVVLGAFENQDFQYDDMVSMINSGNPNPRPLVNIHFAFANYMEGKADFELDGLKFKSAQIEREKTTQYDFKLEVTERDDQFLIEFIYSKAIYDDEMIGLLLNYYQAILKIVLENDQLNIGDIEI
ncbi:non-ribosomal peptide synthetase [Pedobacter steynii]|nr:non-ribosomal peptide synthetase [Pedobacter steynii]